MAYRDGTGPMTGRGAGFCAGVDVDGSVNYQRRQSFGCGRGRAGAGLGRGFKNSYGVGRQRFAAMQNSDNPAAVQNVDAEKNFLKNEAEVLKQSLESVNKRLEKLEAEKAAN